MGLDQIQRHNEPNFGRWKWERRLAGGTRRRCQICDGKIGHGSDVWTDGQGSAHQRCAQQANRRAAASESI